MDVFVLVIMLVGGFLLFRVFGVTSAAKFKGAMGEHAVKRRSRARLSEYREFHNVTLQMSSGTTQIDHVFVSVNGVFVVETKTMQGWIFGSEDQRQWMQILFRNRYRFYNPLLQNLGHMRVLQRFLGVDRTVVHSVVVFMGEATFKTRMPENVVMGAGRMVDYIRSFDRVVLSEADVERICGIIEKKRLPDSRATNRAHVRHVKRMMRGQS